MRTSIWVTQNCLGVEQSVRASPVRCMCDANGFQVAVAESGVECHDNTAIVIENWTWVRYRKAITDQRWLQFIVSSNNKNNLANKL